MNSIGARSNSISQRVMKPLVVDVFTAAKDDIGAMATAYLARLDFAVAVDSPQYREGA